MSERRRLVRGALLAAAALASACVPATFNDLSGGPSPGASAQTSGGAAAHDANKPLPQVGSIPAPRAVSPLSVTWINSQQPHFRWENSNGVGSAVIELSTTRDLTQPKYIFRVPGNDYTPDVKLEPGYWFWHLRGSDGTNDSSASTPTWEFLVRGPGLGGASASPRGSVVDLNADGEPDLVFTKQVKGPKDPVAQTKLLYVPGRSSSGTHSFSLEDPGVSDADLVTRMDLALSGGTDIDGDGYADLAIGDLYNDPTSTIPYGWMWFHYGGPTGRDQDKTESGPNLVPAPGFHVVPQIQMAGDVNGDGFGDVAVSLIDSSFTGFGTNWGVASTEIFSYADPKRPPAALTAGADFDGDGLSDIAVSWTNPGSPIGYVFGRTDRFDPVQEIAFGDVSTATNAPALTSGDFDGDGVDEIAFTSAVAGTPAICVYSPKKTLQAKDCWSATGETVDAFGLSLAAGDLDADGKDEIVVASKDGIVVLTRDGGTFKSSPIAGAFQPRVTMIHPGTHSGGADPARWAAIAADSKTLTIFRGSEVNQVLHLDSDPNLVSAGPSLR